MENSHYNTDNYPHFVMHHGNWDIYTNEQGACAAIAVNPQCQSTQFGDLAYVRKTLCHEIYRPRLLRMQEGFGSFNVTLGGN